MCCLAVRCVGLASRCVKRFHQFLTFIKGVNTASLSTYRHRVPSALALMKVTLTAFFTTLLVTLTMTTFTMVCPWLVTLQMTTFWQWRPSQCYALGWWLRMKQQWLSVAAVWHRLARGHTRKACSQCYTVDVVLVRTGRQFDKASVVKATVSSTSTLDCILFCQEREQLCYSWQDLMFKPANTYKYGTTSSRQHSRSEPQ